MLGGLLLGAALVAGCSKNAPATEAPADSAAADAGAGAEQAEEGEAAWPESPLDDELSSSLAQLEAREDALLAAGVSLPEAVAQERALADKSSDVPADATTPSAARCERICDLATNICALREQICGLADEHTDDVRYAKACDRATQDCDRAKEACDGCDA